MVLEDIRMRSLNSWGNDCGRLCHDRSMRFFEECLAAGGSEDECLLHYDELMDG